MKFFEKMMIEEWEQYIKEQIFLCPNCNHEFKSEWRNSAKCHYCGKVMDVSEAPVQTKGWTDKSVEKFGKSIGKKPKEHGFFDACVAKMSGKVGNPEAFCASLKDKAYDSPMWRGKGKSKKEISKDVKK